MIRVLFFLLPACAVPISVAPGHGAVITTAEGRLVAIGEGITNVPSDAQVDDFDLRQQNETITFNALTADGVPVEVRNAVVTFQVTATELTAFDEGVGNDYARSLVEPVLAHAIGSAMGHYRWDALDAATQRTLEQEVQKIATADLQPYHLAIVSVELKGLFPQLPEYNQAVTDTAVWEQKSATSASRIAIAKQRADELRTKAQGIVAANQAIAPTLSPGVLANETNKAWAKLITSPTATVDVASHTFIEIQP